jgi:uncharacterized protein YbaR (Trm112 family)
MHVTAAERRATLAVMPSEPDLRALLACPRCRGPLAACAGGECCGNCGTRFTRLDGVPWLFAEPAAALGDWRQRLHFHLARLEQDRQRYRGALEGTDGPTHARLVLLERAAQDQSRRLRELLAPLALEHLTSSYPTHIALRTRMPFDQGLATYYQNVHRDWCWGAEENEAAFDLVGQALKADRKIGKLLVLGAGAGRLAYDVHRRLRPELTVALDFNPLLILLAKRIAAGETVGLYEFPLAPRTAEDYAPLRALSAEAPAGPGLEFVLADALHPPFREATFDAVLTPWLIDILPASFDTVCAKVNALLPIGACWVNFGSLSFAHADPALRYGLEECLAALADSGFDAIEVDEAEIPYMCSPASRHGRREKVIVWRARKAAHAPAAVYSALPDWIVTGKDPVPLLPSFGVQAASTRIYAFLMSLIDGRRTLTDIARLLVEQRLMSAPEAEPAVRSFLIKMYEDSRRPTL